LTGVPAVTIPIGLTAVATVATYALRAQRAVFGGSWPITLAKAAAIAVIYLIVTVPAFVIVLIWASMV
jgi:hypothetical protein